MSIKIKAILYFLAIVSLFKPVVRVNANGLEQALNRHKFQSTKARFPVCYAQTESDSIYDLSLICGRSNGNQGGYNRSSGGGGSSKGICNVPSDRDSAGNRCGKRAASERPGGR